MTVNTGKNSGPLHKSTVAVHGGEFVDPTTRASSPNLVMSATFAPTDVTGFSARDEKDYEGFVYGRVASPTVRQLEQKLAALEGAEAALAYASGVAASHALIAGRLSKGDHLVMPDSNYVGVAELTRDTLPRFGIETSFVDTTNPKAVAAEIRPNTRMLWLETPSNPTMQISDIKTLAALAHEKGVRDVVVDSTYATPIATKPLSLGADFVVHSLTKYIGGHGDAMGGAVLGRKADLDALQSGSNGAFRRRALAFQCLAHHAGCRHAAASHEGASGSGHDSLQRVLKATRPSSGCSIRALPPIRSTRWPAPK